MNTVNNLADLIAVRAFVLNCVDNLSVKLSREDVREIQKKTSEIDNFIVRQTLKLDLNKLNDAEPARVATWVSTENADVVANRIVADNATKSQAVAASSEAKTDAKKAHKKIERLEEE